jgi:glutaconate CoA-transferase subunit A
MSQSLEKITSLATAIYRYVSDGAHISIGGFTINRNPMAAVYEIIRQRKRHLHLYAHSNGQGVDELIGAGCVARVEIAYAGSGRFAPTCVRFRKAVESGQIAVEDYSNYQMTLRFMAGAMGVPFLPTRSSLGTDIIARWGFTPEMRLADPKIADMKLTVLDNPFGRWADTQKVVLVPAINPDVTIVHVQQADNQGNACIRGLTFADVEQVKAARCVIVTCETLVEGERMRREPDQNQIPFFMVDAVVPVSLGAYPTACYGHYDYDPVFLSSYRHAASDDQRYRRYLTQRVLETATHSDLLAQTDPAQLEAIQADPRTGYAVGLDRR